MQPDFAKCDYDKCGVHEKCERYHSRHSGIVNYKALLNVDGKCNWFVEISLPIQDSNSNESEVK